MRIYDVIYKKRNKEKLSNDEIKFFINEYTNGNIAEYQASALLMAMFLNGLDSEETANLTSAMMHSGDVVDLSEIKGVKVDKHSTGGVGDTTTLVLGPLVASCGVPVAKMSGRGLGHTGGTLDKLESIPGFSISLSIEEFIDAVNRHGISVIGQTKDIAPADKKLYALRDVTATVDDISLISASIMSKKLASGSDGIVLDVKVGSGAFLKTFEEAEALAKTMVKLGTDLGRHVIAVITNMEQPLGFAIGNSNEVIEAMETLKGKGPEDLTELCLTLGANMLILGGKVKSFEEGKDLLIKKIDSGEALDKFKEFVKSQGGNSDIVEDYNLLPKASFKIPYISKFSGYIEDLKSDDIGIASMILGAGRAEINSEIDLSAGINFYKKIGDRIEKGEVIADLYTNDESKVEEAKKLLDLAIRYSSSQTEKPKLIVGIVDKDGTRKY